MTGMQSKNRLLEYVYIILGTGLMGFCINSVFEPGGIITGGFSGISIMVKRLTEQWISGGIPLWVTNTVLNIPILIAGFKIKGIGLIKKTVPAAVLLSMWMGIIPKVAITDNTDYVLVAVIGGCIMGFGLGLVLRMDATTGGTDMLASLIHHYKRQYSIVKILQIIDGIIVTLGAVFFGIRNALYSIITIYIITKVSDWIIEGVNYGKVAYIISSKYEDIAESILYKMNRGVTGINSCGMYSNKESKILFCAVSKKEIVKLRDIVQDIDKEAFMIVGDVKEIWGRGFMI